VILSLEKISTMYRTRGLPLTAGDPGDLLRHSLDLWRTDRWVTLKWPSDGHVERTEARNSGRASCLSRLYARHCGHADLLRERIDGRVGA
jgi:hypothetical protein